MLNRALVGQGTAVPVIVLVISLLRTVSWLDSVRSRHLRLCKIELRRAVRHFWKMFLHLPVSFCMLQARSSQLQLLSKPLLGSSNPFDMADLLE